MNYGSDKKSALQAKHDAQKISFGAVMFQAARSLKNLGILETVKNAKEGITIEETAEKLGLPVYGVKVLIEAGLSMELVYLRDDKYFITKTGVFILIDQLTQVNMDFNHFVNYLGMYKMEESVKNGKPEGLSVFGDKWNTIYEALAELPKDVQKSWFGFDHYYSDIAFPEIFPIICKSKPLNILDVGGNTGKFAIECAQYDEDVNITILDLPGQVKEAEKNINEAGLSDRISCVTIDLLDHSKPFPENMDVVWMSQFLDCFSKGDIVELLKRGKDALSKNGALYILETLWDKQRFDTTTYCLHGTSLYFTCMANGCSQMYHSQDMRELVDKAGLKLQEENEDIGVAHTLFKCIK